LRVGHGRRRRGGRRGEALREAFQQPGVGGALRRPRLEGKYNSDNSTFRIGGAPDSWRHLCGRSVASSSIPGTRQAPISQTPK
jgi:hypothetical protein